jgi:hypothetical protein
MYSGLSELSATGVNTKRLDPSNEWLGRGETSDADRPQLGGSGRDRVGGQHREVGRLAGAQHAAAGAIPILPAGAR